MKNAIAIGITLTVVFTCLAHGAVESWSVAVFGVLMLVLMLLWAVKLLRDRQAKIHLPLVALPLAALIGYGLVQSLRFAQSDGSVKSLSLDAEATRLLLPVLVSLLAALVLAANIFDEGRQLAKLYNWLTFYGLLLAVFALTQNLAGDGKLIWLRPAASGFGSFVNRNHFAGFMEMLIPLPIALMATGVIRKEARLVYGFAALVMSVALAVSLSRGGFVSLAAGMVFMALLWTRGDRRRRATSGVSSRGRGVWVKRLAGVMSIFVILLAGVVWLAAEKALTRVAGTLNTSAATDKATPTANPADAYSRMWLLRHSGAMIGDHLLFGVGLGAYETAFPAYDDSNGEWVVAQAHNDYAQILADGGIIGGALALAFLALILRAIWQGAAVNDPRLAAAALGSGASIFAMLVHSLFDFNLQIPANALLFLVHCGVVWRAAAVGKAEGKVRQPLAVAA